MCQLKKVAFLLPYSSQYGALQYFTKKLYEAFLKAGHECKLFSRKTYVEEVVEFAADLTVGFNGCPKDKEGNFFTKLTRTPHLACLVDPSYHF